LVETLLNKAEWRRSMENVFGIISVLMVLIVMLATAVGGPHNSAAIKDEALRRSVGQMIMVGFYGVNNTDPRFRHIIEDLESGVIGGVLFLARNVQSKLELETMVREVRRCNCSISPLIAVDEEGGTIERLEERYGFRHTPSAAEIGRSNEENARNEYERLAKTLFDIGFNMNLAPVVDLNTNPTNPIIGSLDRSFSQDPIIVSRYAKIFIEEHHKQRILTTLKHFPGHGSSSTDSHTTIADVEFSWSPEELIPYRTLIGARLVDSIMVGHLANTPKWGGVATQYGSSAIHQMLRTDLKFDGVVLSDDLSMESTRLTTSPFPDVIRSAVKAGVDIIIVSRLNDDVEAVDTGFHVNSALLGSTASGDIKRSSVEQSEQRIRSLKNNLEQIPVDFTHSLHA
jgi:beta-N-acetylhexosaminidase